MSKKIYIEDPVMVEFLYEALTKLNKIETIAECCPRCGHTICFPITARHCDVEAFEELLNIGYKYLGEKGVTDVILADILKRINDRLNIQ